MAQIAYKSAGAGAALFGTTALGPFQPATVDAGDILILHVLYKGTTDTPAPPAAWTLLSGPKVIETTVARHWIYGKIADGTEDNIQVSLGVTAGSIEKHARIYSFSGYVSGTIDKLCSGFWATSHATDPQLPALYGETDANSLVVALVCQTDNNALAAASGATGATWTESVAEFSNQPASGTGAVLQLQHAAVTSWTATGGAVAATNDPSGVIVFDIRDAAVVEKVNTAEGSTNGTTVSVANSGGGSGDAFGAVSIAAGGVARFATVAAQAGSLGYELATRGASPIALTWGEAEHCSFANRLFFGCDVTVSATPTTNCTIAVYLPWTGPNVFVGWSTTNHIFASDGTSSPASVAALVPGTFYRIEWVYDPSGQTFELRLLNAATDELIETIGPFAVSSAGIERNISFGPSSNNAPTNTGFLRIDNIAAFKPDWITTPAAPAAPGLARARPRPALMVR